VVVERVPMLIDTSAAYVEVRLRISIATLKTTAVSQNTCSLVCIYLSIHLSIYHYVLRSLI